MTKRSVDDRQSVNMFVNAFVTASLTVCIGAMAIVGAIQDEIDLSCHHRIGRCFWVYDVIRDKKCLHMQEQKQLRLNV